MTYIDKHFKNIYLLKLACICLALGVVILISSVSIYNLFEQSKKEFQNIADIKFSNFNIVDDTNVNIKNLSLQGKTSSNSNYVITANEANKSLQGIIHMKDIMFIYSETNSSDKLMVSSDSGRMDEFEKLVTIDNAATINFDDYSIFTNKLLLDLKDNTATSNESITITKGHSSYLKADSFSTSDRSNIINLQGNVKASIELSNINNN